MGGKLLTPIYTLDGVIWIDTELMAPTVKKEEGYKRYFVRWRGKYRAIAVKDGMVLSAIIMECNQGGSALYEALDTLTDRTRAEERRIEKDGEAPEAAAMLE